MASISGAHTIVLKAGYTEGGAEHEEGFLTAAAYPGMNVQLSVTTPVNGVYYYTPGSTDYAGTGTVTTTKNPVKILKEDGLQGGLVTTQYAADALAFIHIAKSGDVLQVLVESGQTVVMGDGLSAVASGKWNKDTTNAAVETLEGSGGALGADTLMRVRVL